MRILWNNLIDLAAITSSTEDTAFPISNLRNFHLSKIFKFESNTDEYIDLDLGSSENITGIIFDTNLSNTATVNLYGNSSSDFSSPDYSTTMDVYGDKIVKFLDENYRYWRVEITDTSVTQIWLKYGFIGEYTQMPPMDPDINLEYATTSSVTTSQSGQTYADKGFEVFSTNFTFPSITEYPRDIDGKTIATREELLIMWRYIEGIVPVYLIIWEKNMDKFPPVLGVLTEDTMTFEKQDEDTWQISFGFQETK